VRLRGSILHLKSTTWSVAFEGSLSSLVTIVHLSWACFRESAVAIGRIRPETIESRLVGAARVASVGQFAPPTRKGKGE